MEVTFDRKELAAALRIAGMVRPKTTTIPILQCARVVIGKSVVIEATDVEMFVSIPIEAPNKGKGHGIHMLPIDRALSFVSAASADLVKVSFTDARATITCGGSRAALPVLDPSGWPKMATSEVQPLFEIAGAKLKAITDSVAWAMAVSKSAIGDSVIPNLRFQAVDGNLAISAFGGHVLAVGQTETPLPVGTDFQISEKAATLTARVFGSAETVTVTREHGIVLTDGSVRIECSQLQGSRPPWAKLLTQDRPCSAKLFPASTIAAIGQVEPFAQSLKDLSPSVSLTFTQNQISVECGGDGGEASAITACVYDGPEMRMKCNVGYLVSALKACASIDVTAKWDQGCTGLLISDGLTIQMLSLLR